MAGLGSLPSPASVVMRRRPLYFMAYPFSSRPPLPPVSLVTFHLVVVPALRALGGWPQPALRHVWATLDRPLRYGLQDTFGRAPLFGGPGPNS